MHGTRSLVTGGSEFIGRHVVTALRERGHHVRILDVNPPPDLIPDVEYVAGSVLDRSCIRGALRGMVAPPARTRVREQRPAEIEMRSSAHDPENWQRWK